MTIIRIGNQNGEAPPADVIGVKAANLAYMARLGLPVPPAFVLPIALCARITAGEAEAERELIAGVEEGVQFLEGATGRKFGDHRRPLLVSVRSGAARSMPGMLDTVLDVGCTPVGTHGLVRMTGNPRFAWDCRRRFVDSFATVVLGEDAGQFAAALARMLDEEGVTSEEDLDGEALERLCATYAGLVGREADVLEDPTAQLLQACRAVYASWTSERATTYRRLQKFDDLLGTAVTVQVMVFGNRGRTSGAGVAFSRDPSTGAPTPMIDVLFEAQGEDIVSGRRTPQTEAAIERLLPAVADELKAVLVKLEREFRDVQDVEFTIEEGRLWILQTRPAKRTPEAALRIAVDLVREGLIAPAEGLARLDGLDLKAIGHAHLVDPGTPQARGTGGAAGVASGRVAFDSASAQRLAARGDSVILARPDTSTADVAGFAVAAGILTAAGGRTAHAALVARQLGKACVVGCGALVIDPVERCAQLAGAQIREGDWLSVDGSSGEVFLGQRDAVVERPERELADVEAWRTANGIRRSA